MVRLEIEQFDNKVIVEHNDLITSVSNMNKSCLKLFEIMVANIDSSSAEIANNVVFLSKKNIFELLGYSSANKHTRLKKLFEKLQEAYFEISFIEQTKSGKERKRMQRIIPIPFVEWTNYDDVVEMRLSPEIIPYLINLKSRFTKYSLQDIVALDSSHSIMMYRYLKMVSDQNEAYKKGDICIVSVESLKRLTASENYTNFSNFESRILKSGVDEINDKTSIYVEYEKLKNGRKITDIKFIVKRKAIQENLVECVENAEEIVQTESERKLKSNDEILAEELEIVKKSLEESLEKTNDYININNENGDKPLDYDLVNYEVLKSPFTMLLRNYDFIKSTDLSSVSIAMDLYTKLYPLYSKIVDEYGMEVLENHIAYVRDKTKVQPKYVVKYLQTAVETKFSRHLDANMHNLFDKGIESPAGEPKIPIYKWATKID